MDHAPPRTPKDPTMRRFAVGLLLVASLAPATAFAAGTSPTPVCSLSRFTLALGPTRLAPPAEVLRGDLTSMTWIRVTNDGPTCRLLVRPTVSFDFSAYTAETSLFSAPTSARYVGPASLLRAGERVSLVVSVHAVEATRRGYCEPRTALAVAVTLGREDQGNTRDLFPRTIRAVCANPAPTASNFTVAWRLPA